MSSSIQVTVWGEFRHEKKNAKVSKLYPNGMHETIAEFLRKQPDYIVSTAWLDQPEHGLTQAVLDKTDVLLWCLLLPTSFTFTRQPPALN